MPALTSAAELTWIMVGPFDEEVMYSVHTGERNGADRDALLAAAAAWWITDLDSTLKDRVTLTMIRYKEWNATLGRFEQQLASPQNTAGGSVAVAPPQCAVVVTYRRSTLAVPIRRRYNRLYLGYIATSALESTDGRLTVVQANSARTNVLALHNRLSAVTSVDPLLNGLCVVSQVGGNIDVADEVGCGRVVDTQRRRRADYPDEKTYVALP